MLRYAPPIYIYTVIRIIIFVFFITVFILFFILFITVYRWASGTLASLA
jgi:hypothetical protein